MSELLETLDEIFVTYTTLLIQFDRDNEAIDALDKALTICKYF